jgi:DNA-binding response OmpR family regulator
LSEFTELKLFKEFLDGGTIFIVDENPASSRRLTDVLTRMGARSTDIHRFDLLEDAENKLSEIMPRLVICDYQVGPFSGLDFFQTVREKDPDSYKSAFVIVTSNLDQAAVARAAEEDVDAYIIKPYNMEGIKKTLLTTFEKKVHPSKYMECIAQAKNLLEKNDFAEVLKVLQQALTLSPKPTLAYSYLGLLKAKVYDNLEAKDNYKKGLTFNKIHFKCQKGLYESCILEENWVQAYQVLQTLTKYFPPNGDRLSDAIKLAVMTQNFEDIAEYYKSFKNLPKRTEKSITYVCAGLYVLAKYHFIKGELELGVKAFEKLAVTSSGKPKFIKAIMQSLINEKLYDHLPNFFKKLDTTAVEPDELELIKFYSVFKTSDDGDILKKGNELIQKKVEDYWLYRLTIQSMINAGFKKQAIEFTEIAKKKWPMHHRVWALLNYHIKKMQEDTSKAA